MTHGPDHDCEDCDSCYRQGGTIEQEDASAWGFGLAALGIVALLVAALVMA